jgi:hypothetical protein
MSQNLSASYALNNNIDASETTTWNSGAGFVPVGTFTGRLDGQGYNVTNLYIYTPSTNFVGLFSYVGALIGFGYAIINNSYSTVNVSGDYYVGGLVGDTGSSKIMNFYASGAVSCSRTNCGGLFGSINYGSQINNSYATGNVSSSANAGCDGFSGSNYGTIRNSYSRGNVSCTGSSSGGSQVTMVILSSTLTRPDSFRILTHLGLWVITQLFARIATGT